MLLEQGALEPDEDVVCFVTGHGGKYPVLCGESGTEVSSKAG